MADRPMRCLWCGSAFADADANPLTDPVSGNTNAIIYRCRTCGGTRETSVTTNANVYGQAVATRSDGATILRDQARRLEG